jgi:hypothetical protein
MLDGMIPQDFQLEIPHRWGIFLNPLGFKIRPKLNEGTPKPPKGSLGALNW